MQPERPDGLQCKAAAPLHFRVRRESCRKGLGYVGDIQSLSGYLHDARFSADAVTKQGKKLSIVMERDCWELGFTRKAHSSELHIARSCRSITPVSHVRWEISDPRVFAKELWLESIYVGPCHWEKSGASELVLSAPHQSWRFCVFIADDFGRIRLDDLETPYLYSTNKASNLKPSHRAK